MALNGRFSYNILSPFLLVYKVDFIFYRLLNHFIFNVKSLRIPIRLKGTYYECEIFKSSYSYLWSET